MDKSIIYSLYRDRFDFIDQILNNHEELRKEFLNLFEENYFLKLENEQMRNILRNTNSELRRLGNSSLV